MTARGSGDFTPLAVEVYGCLRSMFYDFLRECAAASETGGAASFTPETEYVHRLTHLYMQRISMTLQRTQARAFRYSMARAPARWDPALRGEEEQTRRMHQVSRVLGEDCVCHGDVALVEPPADF